MKLAKFLIPSLLAVSAAAIACGDPLPLPSVPGQVVVSLTDMGKAYWAGYGANSVYAAALIKLDSAMASVMGAAQWRDNAFSGYFWYSGPVASAANSVYFEKECGKKAIEKLPPPDAAAGGGGDGSGAGGSGGGSYTTIVGYRVTWKTYSACATGVPCTSGIWYYFEPVYGTMDQTV